MTPFFDTTISERNSEKMIINDFLALVASVFDAHSVVLFQPDSENQAAKIKGYFSLCDSIDEELEIPQGKGLVGWILKNKEPLLYNVAESQQPNLGYYMDETEDYIRSFIGTPIAGGGALCIDSKKMSHFPEHNQKLLNLFAKLVLQIQDTIQKNHKSSHVDGYFHILEQLADLKKHYSGWSSFLRKFLHIIAVGSGFEYVAFASLAQQKNHYIIEGEYPPRLTEKEFSFSSGIVGWVFRNEETIQNDGHNNTPSNPIFGNIASFPSFRASVCIPIKVDKHTVGVLCFASTAPKDLTNEFKLFTRIICEDLAQFLEIVSLRYRVYRQSKKAIDNE